MIKQPKFFFASCLFIAIGTVAACNGAGEKKQIEGKRQVLFIQKGPDNPRNSEGDFITLKDGRILYVYTRFTGDSYMDHAPAFLASRYSDDQGDTWSEENLRVVEQEGTQNVMSVSLLRLASGEIAMFYLRKNSITDCLPMVRFSTDEGKSWTDPQRCITDREGYFVLHNDRVIQLEDGRLVFAVASSGLVYSYYSDDDGRSWASSTPVPNPDGVVHQEPGLVQLKNGDLYMIMRTDTTTQYGTLSSDGGKTWRASQASNIISASQSPASLARVPTTGDLVLVWNHNDAIGESKAKRTPLSIAISTDEGKSWQHEQSVEDDPSGSFCYTAIHFVDDGVLLAYFDWATLQITITKLSLGWIYKNQVS